MSRPCCSRSGRSNIRNWPASGAVIDVEVSYVLNEPDSKYSDQIYWSLHGTAGGASFTRNTSAKGPGQLKVGRCDLKTGQWQDLPRAMPSGAASTGVTLLGDFVDSILAGREPLAPGDQAAAVIEIIEAAYQSSRTGQVVDRGK